MTYCPYCNGGGHDNFNSHAHVERDISAKLGGNKLDDFNSHAHVERDETMTGFMTAKTISTHTLTWSVTIQRGQIATSYPFQLTRSRGA